ncbi:MAG: sulfur transferase domain-containing protein [Planctomycetota bacterium]
MKLDWMMSWIVLATIGLGGCGSSTPTMVESAEASAPAAEPEPVELHRDGRFIVSGQPNEPTLRALAKEGITTVVSCRSVEEMDGLDFDQVALLNELGLEYVHIPMGRDHGYEPGQVAAFTESVRSTDGPVYVHCASGGRARYAIMGYLIREQGYSVDEAMAASRRLGASERALDRLLGEPVRYGLTERDVK